MEESVRESFARSSWSPTRERRRQVVLLRGLLVIAVGGLLIDAPRLASVPAAIVLICVLATLNVVLQQIPLHIVGRPRFELIVSGVDILLVAAGMQLAGVAGGPLPASCLLMVLVVALGNYRFHAIAGAAAIGAFHAWLLLGPSAPAVAGRRVALQMLFLCAVGLYFGFLARRVHRIRRVAEAERFERRELGVLLDVLEKTTSSLDLREVALAIVRRIAVVIPSVRCSMLFVDPTATRCFVLASHDNPDLDTIELDLDKYPEVRRALQTRDSVLVQNVPDDPIMRDVIPLLSGLDFQSILVVPLNFGNEVLGTLCLKTARAREEFSQADINFCTAVARASANALKNALLHDSVVEEATRHRRTSEKLTRILDHSPDLIMTTDLQGRITEFNIGAERLLGRSRHEVVGQSCESLFGPTCGKAVVERICREGQIANHPCSVARSDGAEVSLEMNMSVLGTRGEEALGTVWVGRDVSELKSAQLQLLQAKKLSTIGEVISGVAHELNNPLSGVLGFSQLLMARNSTGSVGRELERIHDSALRCQKIVRNLLSFARVHKPERQYLGVNGILEKTLDLRKYQLTVNNVEVVRNLDPDLPRTMLDFHQMQQVFINLINNAQHAIASSNVKRGKLTIETASVDGTIQIKISDNGVGMDQETLERIFDPFFTTKAPGQGTGLGLSVSYGIVKEHEGRIYARSRRGHGTTFVITLPIRERTVEESVLVEEIPPVTVEHRGGDMLVVDDEPLILDLMIDVFREQGYRVDTAANGSEACRKIRAQPYDVVLTDVRMPEMNGMELYSHILSIRPEMEGRVLFMTGDLIDKETVDFLTQIEARGIPKPIEIPLVVAAVAEKMVQRQEQRGDAARVVPDG